MSDQEAAASGGSPFEAIRHLTEDGTEYWSARELARVLGYTEYGKFGNTVKKAETACEGSGQALSDHFAHVSDMIATGKGAHRQVEDVQLSRYACYLIVQNADPDKPIVALGQTYFAVQTRRAELADELAAMPEAQRRLAMRDEVVHRNVDLAAVAATQAGLVSGRDFATFQDHGYRGLYGGETARQIAARKRLGPREKILDWMESLPPTGFASHRQRRSYVVKGLITRLMPLPHIIRWARPCARRLLTLAGRCLRSFQLQPRASPSCAVASSSGSKRGGSLHYSQRRQVRQRARCDTGVGSVLVVGRNHGMRLLLPLPTLGKGLGD